MFDVRLGEQEKVIPFTCSLIGPKEGKKNINFSNDEKTKKTKTKGKTTTPSKAISSKTRAANSYITWFLIFVRDISTIIMFRSAVIRSLRLSVPRVARAASPVSRQVPAVSSIARQAQFAPSFSYQAIRSYSAPAGLNQTEVQGRIVDLLKNFDKVRTLI